MEAAALGTISEAAKEQEDPLRSTHHRWRVIPREIYDTERSTSAPDSKRTVKKYVLWIDVCRAADGLYPDGRYIGLGHPGEVPDRHDIGRGRIYTDQDCLDAIHQCQQRIGRWPSSGGYITWRRGELKRLRRGRNPAEARVPAYDVIIAPVRGLALRREVPVGRAQECERALMNAAPFQKKAPSTVNRLEACLDYNA